MSSWWLDQFTAFFEVRGADLAAVLGAARCREGWLQGELYLRMRANAPGFQVNAKAGNLFFDLHAPAPRPLFGELKILGDGYQPKVVTGGGLRAIRPYMGKPISVEDRDHVVLGRWGLVPDFFRLLDATAAPGTAKLLVLVADIDDKTTDAVGSVLATIDFACASRTVRLSRGFVRIWDVGQSSHTIA